MPAIIDVVVMQVDIEALRRRARYANGFDKHSQVVRWLWRVLKDFTHEQRQNFLKFVWANPRLSSMEADGQEFTVIPLALPSSRKPDDYYPRSRTYVSSWHLNF